MSERYALFEIENLRERYQLANGVPKGVKASYNISPVQLAPVVVNRNGVNELVRMKWGLIPQGAKDTNSVFRYKTFNVKSEGILTKPATRELVSTQRCIIPVNGFYQWHQTAEGKQAYFVRVKNQPIFSLAGIYSSWTDPEGKVVETYSIVTTQPNVEIATISRRMPVILHPEDEATWLDPSLESVSTLYGLMGPYTDGQLHIKQVGSAIDSKKVDGSELITT
jgi:putative SOS response-associated peptidase YedK